MFEITIPGEPLAKKRPKFAKRGNFVSVYDPGKKESDAIRLIVQSQWPHKPIETPIELMIVFNMPIPASWSKKRKEHALKAAFHFSKPDLDNLLKFVADVLTGIVFIDDRQIYKITAEKKYAEIPRTEIKIIASNLEKW